MTDTPLTLDQLLNQQRAVQEAIDQVQIAPLEELVMVLNHPIVAEIVEVLQERIPQLNGDRQIQANNVLTILSNTPNYLANELVALKDRFPEEPAPIVEPGSPE